MQFLDLLPGRSPPAASVDHIVRGRKPSAPVCLCADGRFGRGSVDVVALHQPFNLSFKRTVYHQDARNMFGKPGLHEQGDCGDHVGTLGLLEQGQRPFANPGVQDRFQFTAPVRVRENEFAQRSPIELAARIDYACAECAAHFLERSLPWRHDLAGDRIRVDQCGAEAHEHVGDR